MRAVLAAEHLFVPYAEPADNAPVGADVDELLWIGNAAEQPVNRDAWINEWLGEEDDELDEVLVLLLDDQGE